MNNSELIKHLEECLRLIKEQEEILAVPKDEIVSTEDRFFIFPRRIHIKSTGKKTWRIGTVKNCRKIKTYYRDFVHPESDCVGIFYSHFYEID